MKIASWNVNSIKVRLPHLLTWLKKEEPDMLFLQEIKCEETAFPFSAIEMAGYHAYVKGQKSYNGVALLSKKPFTQINKILPGDESDQQARFIEAIEGNQHFIGIYLPNGNPLGSEKFLYKLAWMDRLYHYSRLLQENEKHIIILGDFNIIPNKIDCYDPSAWIGDALYSPEARKKFFALKHLGFEDSFRLLHPDERAYSFWDYQGGAWQRNKGIRIDHCLSSPYFTDRLLKASFDKKERGKTQPSDHVPLILEFKD